eukprot:6311624-Prymnesium_polylepis.1
MLYEPFTLSSLNVPWGSDRAGGGVRACFLITGGGEGVNTPHVLCFAPSSPLQLAQLRNRRARSVSTE